MIINKGSDLVVVSLNKRWKIFSNNTALRCNRVHVIMVMGSHFGPDNGFNFWRHVVLLNLEI